MVILGDGERHSGVALASRLGVTRAAVSKAVGALADAPIQVSRKGYQLPAAFRPLDRARILGFLAERGPAVDDVHILPEVDSTNAYVLRSAGEGVVVCLAERQSAGRGRRGRAWQATPYGSLLLSVGMTLQGGGPALGVLSLAAGVAVQRALRGLGVGDTALKWPNDVLWQARKLAGLLVEMRGEPEALRVVLGVGLNVAVGPVTARAIDQEWAELSALTPHVDRDRLAAAIVGEWLDVVAAYRAGAAAALLEEWRTHHAFAGIAVRVHVADAPAFVGIAEDVTSEGALLVNAGGARRVVRSGEVSVRPL